MRTLAVEVARVVDDTVLATGVPARYGSTFVDAGAFDFWCRRRVSTLGRAK